MNVLVVEPDHVVAESVCHELEAQGCRTSVVRSAQYGLDAMDHFQPECVVLEVQLGIHNGVEFIYEVRSHDDLMHVPIIIYSNNRRVLDERFTQAWKQSGVQVLYKPKTTPRQLARRVLQSRV